jgi:sulfotransferase family protein
VEKTPANLLMTRFLQAAFPNSYFIVIRRHPVPVSMGTPKLGQASFTSLHRLFEHWLHCHQLFEQDKKYLKHLYELTYEDYVEDPAKYHGEIAAFIGTRVPKGAMEGISVARSKKYLDRWSNFLMNSFFKDYYQYIARKYEPRFAKYGYSLTKGLGSGEEVLREGGKTSDAVGTLCCLGADAYALMGRLLTRPPLYIRRQIKALLPESVLTRIRQARQTVTLSKRQAKGT